MLHIFCILITLVSASPPTTLNSIKSNKEVVFHDMIHSYALYHIEYDQDIYYVDNWPCSCSIGTIDYSSIDDVDIDNSIMLDQNELIELIADTDGILFKFYLPIDTLSSVNIIISNHWGIVNGYIGVNRIPTEFDYDFIKHSSTRDSIRVCPSREKWNVGWWYVLVVPAHSYINNHFEIKWDLVSIPTCDLMVNNGNILTNNQDTFGDSDIEYYTFPISGCVNFSISARSLSDGDVDIFISLTNHTFQHYSSNGIGDNVVSVMNLCDHNGWLYITIQSDGRYVVTPTIDTGFILRPIVDLPAEQFKYNMAYDQATLICDGVIVDNFEFLPPHQESNVWIIVPSIPNQSPYRKLPWWNITLPSISDNINKRLTFIQHLTSETSNNGIIYSVDIECRIQFNNMLTNIYGEVLGEHTPFEQGTYECMNNPEVYTIKDRMINSSDIGMLDINSIQISHAMFTQSMLGCKYFADSMCFMEEYIVDWSTCDSNITFNRTRPLIEIKAEPYDACLGGRIFYYIFFIPKMQSCTSQWESGQIGMSSDFIYQCAHSLFGMGDMIGKYCISDHDCMYGATCDLTFGRCNHTIEHISQCWLDNINPNIMNSIVSYWNLPGTLNLDMVTQLISNYTDQLCTGPGSMNYRQHILYVSSDGCNDICYHPDYCINQCDLKHHHYYQLVDGMDGCENNDIRTGCYDCSQSMLNNGECELLNLTEEECVSINVSEWNSGISYYQLDLLIDYLYPQTEGCFTSGSDTIWGSVIDNTTICDGLWLDTLNPSIEACYDGYQYLTYDIDKCNCNGYSWQPIFPIINSINHPRIIRPLLWNTPSISRQIQPTIDFNKLYNDMQTAINIINAQSYRDTTDCVSKLVDVYHSIDCALNNGTRCYNSTSHVLNRWVCPFTNNIIDNPSFTITTSNTTIPQGSCHLVSVSLTALTTYQTTIQSRLSSQTFTEQSPNQWSVIKDHNVVLIGQIIGNAIGIKWDFIAQDNITICLSVIGAFIEDPMFDTYQVGIVNGTSVTVYRPATKNEKNQSCFLIDKPGVYIAIKTRDISYNSILIQSMISATIYILLALIVVYQIINIVLTRIPRWQLKLLFAILIILFLAIRAIYFILYPFGVVDASNGYVFFELPTIMFIVMNTIIIFLWVEITRTVEQLGHSSKFTRKLFICWIIWNSIMLMSFTAIMISYYWSIQMDEPPCNLYKVKQTEESLIVNKVYVISVVSVCSALTIIMVIAGIKLIVPHINNHNRINKKILRFAIASWLLMCVFTIIFTVKSILIIVSAFTDFTTPIMLFTILEQFAILSLIYYLKPKLAEQMKKITPPNPITRHNKKSSDRKSSEKKSNDKKSSDKKSIIKSETLDSNIPVVE